MLLNFDELIREVINLKSKHSMIQFIIMDEEVLHKS